MKYLLVIIPGVALVLWLLLGALRRQMKWNEEKEAHRRYGGTAPKK